MLTRPAVGRVSDTPVVRQSSLKNTNQEEPRLCQDPENASFYDINHGMAGEDPGACGPAEIDRRGFPGCSKEYRVGFQLGFGNEFRRPPFFR